MRCGTQGAVEGVAANLLTHLNSGNLARYVCAPFNTCDRTLHFEVQKIDGIYILASIFLIITLHFIALASQRNYDEIRSW